MFWTLRDGLSEGVMGQGLGTGCTAPPCPPGVATMNEGDPRAM